MFCPSCGAEYLPGAARCVDCDVALTVERSPQPPETSRSDYAPIWKRGVSKVIDSFFAIGMIAVGLAIGDTTARKGVLMYPFLLVGLTYLYLADALPGGQSLGKRVLGIAVVKETSGRPCTIIQSLVRNLLVVVLGPVDWLLIFGRKHRRLGDMAAHTIVTNQLPNKPLQPAAPHGGS